MSTALAAVLAQHAVILGSKSASRQAMLREMSVKFEVQACEASRWPHCSVLVGLPLFSSPD